MKDQSTAKMLGDRGYTHTPAVKRGTGRHAIVRNGRIVAVLTCFEANEWICRWDRKVAALKGASK